MNDKKTIILNHPLAEHYVGILRNEKNSSEIFRRNLNKLTNLLAFKVTENLKAKKIKINTPIQATTGEILDGDVILLPILRSGLGMLNAFEKMIPNIKIGQIGYYRDEISFQAHKYYFKVPQITDIDTVILLDPMLATGNTIFAVLKELTKYKIKTLCVATLFAAPEGLEKIRKAFPELIIYTVKIDEKLNNKKYIVPGLGDAGDRFFNT